VLLYFCPYLCHFFMDKRPGIRTIGILSHVDAGKTTLTEQFLFKSGVLKVPGNVDKGTTVSDSLDIERQRGISVRASGVSFFWKSNRINLIDTPGHADFSAEVERTLQVMDGVILLVSAVEGLQAHTYALWDALQKRKIPILIFINKIDRPGSDFHKIVDEIEKELGVKTFAMNCPTEEGSQQADIIQLIGKAEILNINSCFDHSLENISDFDEEIMDAFLEGKTIEPDHLLEKVKTLSRDRKIIPVLTGIAKSGLGIAELMNALTHFITAVLPSSGRLSALVYKIEHHPALGILAHIRLFDGEIKVRDPILNIRTGENNKIARIKKYENGKLIDCDVLHTGDLGIVSGLRNLRPGDILDSDHSIPPPALLRIPMMTVQIKPANENDFTNLAQGLEILNIEDPKLDLQWFKEDKELHLGLMGKIQMETLAAEILERFGIAIHFGQPTIIYKETPVITDIGFASYTMPKPCWAVCSFAIEPGARGTGISYRSQVSVDKIKQKYQNEIQAIISKSLNQGIKGWEVCDIRITLVDGEDHEIHSRPGDFIIATPMALMNGLQKTGTTLLEPILNFTIKAPETLLGKISGDLHKMRGQFDSPVFSDDYFVLAGQVPAATSLDYAIELASLSGGKAQIRFAFQGYAPVADELGVIRPYRGINPLDRSRWILHKRGAFKANERG